LWEAGHSLLFALSEKIVSFEWLYQRSGEFMNIWRNMSLKSKIALLPALAIIVLLFIEVAALTNCWVRLAV
jgi:hypothetical protein